MPKCGLSFLQLSTFRSHSSLTLRDLPQFIMIHGPNGSGKTNILEACSLLTYGRGLRQALPKSICSWDSPHQTWALEAELSQHPNALLRTSYERGSVHRSFAQTPLTSQQAHSFLQVFWHTPQLDHLLCAPTPKRQLLDRTTGRFFPDHMSHLAEYTHFLKQRQSILKEQSLSEPILSTFEEKMSASAHHIITARQKCVDILQKYLQNLTINNVAPNIQVTSSLDTFWAQTPEASQELFKKSLFENRRSDRNLGRCHAGPHLSRINFYNSTKQSAFELCSTGQKKILSILFTVACLQATHTQQASILLLDETFSHLDPQARIHLEDLLCSMQVQVWSTTLEPIQSNTPWHPLTLS